MSFKVCMPSDVKQHVCEKGNSGAYHSLTAGKVVNTFGSSKKSEFSPQSVWGSLKILSQSLSAALTGCSGGTGLDTEPKCAYRE